MTSLPIDGPIDGPIRTPDVHDVYTGRTTSWPMVAFTVVLTLLVVVMSRQADAPSSDLIVPLLLVGIGMLAEVLTASSVRATAGPNGFTVHWGIVGWPRCTYALDEIERAEVIDVPWWRVSYGFWWTPKRTVCTVRSGPTVRLTLRTGRTVTVTVPDPHTAVAALHAATA